jgi:hypothetical protein
MLIVTIIAAVIIGIVPHWMQISGLLMGTVGVSVLTKFIGAKRLAT